MTDLRALPFAEMLAHLREHGEPADPRGDIDTASLRRRFPHLSHVELRELTFEGARGPQPARLYRDSSAVPSGRAFVWVHGGAFVGGHLDMPESHWVALELAARGIPVLALDYTKCLGDTHFPVPSDDVAAGWRLAVDNAEELFGVGPDAIVLGGASAGGTLVTGVAARLRDGAGPAPAGLVPVYPALHPNGGAPGEPLDPTAPIGRISVNFAGPTGIRDPYAFPGLGRGDGYPPVLVVVCELDDLRPSGEAFAELIRAAGGTVAVHLEPGAGHGHINEPADPTALPTVEAIAKWIRRVPVGGSGPTRDAG
ncbi:MAG: alpha/beta hydrolase fold domain-containing protein [Microbacterium enclense]